MSTSHARCPPAFNVRMPFKVAAGGYHGIKGLESACPLSPAQTKKGFYVHEEAISATRSNVGNYVSPDERLKADKLVIALAGRVWDFPAV